MSEAGWLSLKIRDITTKVGSGATPKGGQDSYHSNGTPLIRSMNVHFNGFREEGLAYLDSAQAAALDGAVVSGKDVLLNITGASIGRVTLAPDHLDGARVNQHVCIIRPRQGINPSFLRWFLASPTEQSRILRTQVGATRQALTKEMILNFEVPVPPVAEQDRITSKIEELLSDLDAGVAALERARANLKKYRAAVLKAAVTGDLTADWRAKHSNVEPASKLLDRILSERRQKWEADQQAKFAASGKTPQKGWQAKFSAPQLAETSPFAEMPSGWCWASVDQLGVVQLGRQRSPDNRSDKHPVQYIRAANITEKGLDLSDLLDMEFSPVEQEVFRLQPGDIVLSEASGSPEQVGKPAVWAGELSNCCFQNTVIRLRPSLVGSNYLLIVFQHFYVNKVFARAAAGVGINHLSAGKFAALFVPLAPLAEQEVIVSLVEQYLSSVEATNNYIAASLKRAARLRQSILKEAFAGRLVPQDPKDEPASVLLDRIRQAREPANGAVKSPRRRVSSKQAQTKEDA